MRMASLRVMVRLGEPLWRVADTFRLYLEFTEDSVTVADVLARLAATYSGFDAAYRGQDLRRAMPYQVFVNARIVSPGTEAQRQLVDGDKVYIFLPAVGGQDVQPLPQSFYLRPTLEVARDLLGRRLVRWLDGRRISGRIVEVEAYVGESDQASHAARGRTDRNRAMYGPGGLAYVYFIYGMYHCLNVVTEAAGFPAAVLVRSVEPLEGMEAMAERRPGQPVRSLANGPGKLCQAMGIDRRLDGHDLTAGAELWLEAGQPVLDAEVQATPRVNVIGDAQARTAPWRFLAVSCEPRPLSSEVLG